MSYSDAIAEAYASAPLDDINIDTIELYHPNFIDEEGRPTAVRVALGYDDWVLKLENEAILNAGQYVTFLGCEFTFSMPEFSDDSSPSIQITISNVSREIARYLELAQSSLAVDPIKLTYRPYLASDTSKPQMDPPIIMELSDVDVDAFQATGTATLQDIHNAAFPNNVYDYKRFPGLKR